MNKRVAVKSLIFIAILLASIGVAGGYALQSESVSLEVKEPLEVVTPDSSLSLFPGETLQLEIVVENRASVSYNACLIFSLNDTDYQKFVTFSNNVYTVEPGRNNLEAWLSVSNTAPAAELELTVNITRDLEPSSAEPRSSEESLAPSLILFGAGARWAGKNGTSALYINWFDNYCAHHFSDGADWGPYWREGQLEEIKNVTVNVLEQQGFIVTCVGDVPNDLASYGLVVFEAWFAIEPKHTQLVREYLTNGGNVVIIGGAPCYFATYCKDLWPYLAGGENLAALQDWFGSAQFVNSGGSANLVVDEPFGTSLEAQCTVYHIDAYGCYALTSMSNDAQIIARWSNGVVFAFTHEFGNGRVYYQAEMDW
jgi:hypothetical protein